MLKIKQMKAKDMFKTQMKMFELLYFKLCL